MKKKRLSATISFQEPKQVSLIVVRFFFVLFLLTAAVFEQASLQKAKTDSPFLFLYTIVAASFFLTFIYSFSNDRTKHAFLHTSFQLCIDSFLISLIIYVTGGYDSLFTFLYLLLVIYAATVLFLYGGLFIAALNSLQYAVLLGLESRGYLLPVGYNNGEMLYDQDGSHILYRIVITSTACFAVAILSGLLTEQNKRARMELRSVEGHLKRVEKMAYMGEMAAGLAHEIKNPLASLVGSIQLLKEELYLDADHQRLMEIVLRETDRLGTLVNDFLFFARPPAGKPEKLHLKDAIDDIITVFSKDQSHADKRSIFKEMATDVWILMDPSHLKQILWNLLLNAAEAIEKDGRIIIRVFRDKKNDAHIEVEDNGCGMPEEVIQSIFDPFFTTKSEGTGLGLSIVHRILEAYESRLEVHSQENNGTVFSFSLKSVKPPL